MFTARLKLKDGLSRWVESLPRFLLRGSGARQRVEERSSRPEPRTEGERSLYQAMGWSENAWED